VISTSNRPTQILRNVVIKQLGNLPVDWVDIIINKLLMVSIIFPICSAFEEKIAGEQSSLQGPKSIF
jgi:hypothetical protein